ncbi:MAG: BNR-4 repeat-containing protein, partial [Kiritimatiellae bacterium]|nr:BNR-4 repeat-containing protein [Kiritimatiellia bacterium]
MYKPKNSFYTLLLGIVVFTLSNNSGRAAGHPTLTVSSDSIVDASAMNFSTGRWGTSLNGQAFQQDGVVTYNGYQYAAYFDANKRPAVGRRALPSGAWETFSFNDYGPITHTDAHNVIVVGICPEDGSIHLSYDHHVDDLNYRRSVANVATNPSQVQWTQALFGSNSSQLVSGSTLDRVTYPMFFTTPEGKLQFTFRDGSSGAGDWYLYEYTSGAWQNLGMLFSRSGNFQGGADRCAYPNTMRYDSSGRLHVSWTWRETTDLITNHDLGYAYSDDRGRTWKNNDGTTIATLDGSSGSSNAISINSIGHVVYPMPINWGIMNQTTQFIDSQGRVHIIYWRNPDSASSGTSDVNEWQYYHYWREVSGVWHERELPFTGRKPQVVLDQDDNMYIIHGSGPDLEFHDFDPGVTLTIASATEASGWTDWVLTPQFQATTFHGEPLIDLGRWDSDDILSVYFQEKPSTAGNSSALHVIDFVPSTLPDPMGGSVVPYTSEADTLALYHFDESSGALVNSQGNTSLNLSDTGGASGRDGNSANGSGYGLSSFPGFDSAFNVLDSGDGGYHSSSSSVGGGAITAGNVAQSALQGASGEFTYEAVIKLGNISSSDEQVIISHDGAESSRGFLLKVNNGQLGFYDGSSTTWAAIPTSGAHSFVTDEWFHVAVTYTGAAGQSDNLKLYWTRLDSSATEAHLIGTGVLAADLSGAVSNKLGVGTTTRNPFRFEIDAIDEVRISRVARSADDFIFVELPDPPAAPSVPTNLTASDGDASASLSWTGSAGASTYNVKRSLNNGGSYSVIASNVVGSSYTDSGLTNGTTYYYVVSAENAAGESTNSSEVSATPQSSTSG